MKADDMTQLARFAYDMALTAPEDVIKRQALFNAYMKLHDEVRAALAPAAHGAGEVEAIRERVEKGVRNHPTAVEAQKDRATLLRLLDAERARRVDVEKAARQLLNGASGHYMNAEDRWCLESLLGFYDEDMPATHKDTQDE